MSDISVNALLAGERRTLSKAITLIESSRPDDVAPAQALVHSILPYTGQSVRIGISGSPGVGKSTFIDALGMHAIGLNHKVAVLAVDPSSPTAGGSILGDKTRMPKLSKQDNAFIRPTPAGTTLGGVARRTREVELICEAAGYDVVLVETVGVGQSEHVVASMVDFFLVMLLPNAGDELQGLKKGILELAHVLVVNKADGGSKRLAKCTQSQYQSAVNLFSTGAKWERPVLSCSALNGEGIKEVWATVLRYMEIHAPSEHRAIQTKQWLDAQLYELFEASLADESATRQMRAKMEAAISRGEISTCTAASEIMKVFRRGNDT